MEFKHTRKVVNNQGKSIIDLCNIFNLKILNGRSEGDPMGNFTCNGSNIGVYRLYTTFLRRHKKMNGIPSN